MYEVALFKTASLCCALSMPMSLTNILVQDWSALAGRHRHHWRSTLMPALWAVRVLRHWCSFRFAHQVFLFQIFFTFYIFLQFKSLSFCAQHRFLLRSAEILLFLLCKFDQIRVWEACWSLHDAEAYKHSVYAQVSEQPVSALRELSWATGIWKATNKYTANFFLTVAQPGTCISIPISCNAASTSQVLVRFQDCLEGLNS